MAHIQSFKVINILNLINDRWLRGGPWQSIIAGMLGGAQTQPAVLAYSNDITAADPRAIPAGALVEPDGQPLSTVPTVPTPANDDGGQP